MLFTPEQRHAYLIAMGKARRERLESDIMSGSDVDLKPLTESSREGPPQSYGAILEYLQQSEIHVCGEIVGLKGEGDIEPEAYKAAQWKSDLWQRFAMCHLDGGRLELARKFITALIFLHEPFELVVSPYRRAIDCEAFAKYLFDQQKAKDPL